VTDTEGMRRRTVLTAAVPFNALVIALVAAALSLALVGCSRGSERSAGGDGATSAGGIGDSSTTTLAHTVTGAVDLRKLVVSDAPAGYELLASPPWGAIDLPRLLADFSDAPADDKVILESARFTGGYARAWLRADPRGFLAVFVLEFADDEGARSAREQFASQNVAQKNASDFGVEGIAGATGESYTLEVAGQPPERVHEVTFVRGPRLYQVDGHFADLELPIDETVAFARTQDQIAA
jgi:hypothetical protein